MIFKRTHFNAGNLHEMVEQVGNALQFQAGDFQKAPLAIIDGSHDFFGNEVNRFPDGSQRRPDFMAEHGDKIGADPVFFAESGSHFIEGSGQFTEFILGEDLGWVH